ncbi:MAG: PPC domain-containing protein, partial [Cyanobacteria bacterium P01_H01_bin.130]
MRIWIGAIALGMLLGMPAGGAAWAIAPQIFEGELTEDDETFGDDTHVDIYQFEGKAGETVAIELISDDFDARLSIFHNGELVAGDDDSGQGRNALVIVELPADGTYFVGANAVWAGQQGRGQYQVAWRSPTDLDRQRFEVAQLTIQGHQLYRQAKLQEALALFQQAKEAYVALGDRQGEGLVLSHSSLVYADLAEYDKGIA